MNMANQIGDFVFWTWVGGSVLLAAGGIGWLLAERPTLRSWMELKAHVLKKIKKR